MEPTASQRRAWGVSFGLACCIHGTLALISLRAARSLPAYTDVQPGYGSLEVVVEHSSLSELSDEPVQSKTSAEAEAGDSHAPESEPESSPQGEGLISDPSVSESLQARLPPHSGAGSGSGAETIEAPGASGPATGRFRNPAPRYPELARRLGQEGTVLLRVLVGTDGRASQVETAETPGFPLLDDAARAAVLRWRFRPARSAAGVAVSSTLEIPIVFRLKESR